MLASGFFIPPMFLAIEKLLQWLVRKTTTGLTWALLVPFFYLCFLPGRFFLRIRGKDPLHRRFPTNEPTYWMPHEPVRDLSQYRKQF